MNYTRLATSEFDERESKVRYYCRQMPAVFARALNARMWDEDGVEYIDFLSACGSLNYGHNHPRIKAGLIDYLASDGVLNALDLHTVAKRDFLCALREIILEPRGLDYRVQFTGPSGTNAVEAALKLARKVTGRRSIVAFTNAFHGMSLGALSVTARGRHQRSAGVQLGDVVRLPYDGYVGAGIVELDRFEAMVEDPSGGLEAPAAFIVETIQGEGGLNSASAAWLQHLARLSRRLGSVLIVDDIQAGCGRTGDFFSFEKSGISPDIVCLAKSIGGIGLPLAVVLIKPEYDQWGPGEHNGTFRGNNLAFVAGTSALQLWRESEFQASLGTSIATVQSWIEAVVMDLGACRVHAKGRGMISGLAFADHEAARLVAAEAFRRNLIIETSGPHSEVIKLLPPLTIEHDLLEEGLMRLRSAIDTAVGQVRLRPAA
ncbi:MAG: diaminobutyrate--2-oxoglutarate transaminase [Xanthobacteraceae bacterium]